MPDAIQRIPLKVFFLALLWTFSATAGPALFVEVLWWLRMAPQPDWPTLWRQAVFHGLLGAYGFYRKNKAHLTLPPLLEQVKQVTTTVQSTEQQTSTQVTTTVLETKTKDL